jgi:hypothetical protein
LGFNGEEVTVFLVKRVDVMHPSPANPLNPSWKIGPLVEWWAWNLAEWTE